MQISRNLKILGFVGILSTAALFQNCSQVAFTPTDTSQPSVNTAGGVNPPPPLICNPLAGQICPNDSGSGLIGNLYYMTEALQGGLFSGDLNRAKLNDYYSVGTRVPNLVIMDQINITPRAWTSGFVTGQGSVVESGPGEKLFEWFALDLAGSIELPSGDYHLAQISDDGMRVEVDGAVVLLDDGTHPPRWKCSTISISGSVKHSIRVGYFQGPRNDIAMTLMMRPVSQAGDPCDSSGGWQEIPASAFTH